MKEDVTDQTTEIISVFNEIRGDFTHTFVAVKTLFIDTESPPGFVSFQ